VDEPLPRLPEIADETLKIFLASRNVISEYYQIKRDELQLERRTLLAPFNGTFKEVYMETGAFTNAGGRVARAIQTDQLEMEVPLLRDDAVWIQLGDPVTVIAPGTQDRWEGTVIRKGQFVDENTQRQTVFVRINSRGGRELLSGEYLPVRFPVRPIQNVMEIPRNSVFNTNEVFVVRNGRLAKEKINVVKENERTLIFNGLPEGDSIVVQQLINVSEGTLVQTSLEAARSPGANSSAGNPGKDPQGSQRKE
jgi:RND family efflux transporter MFP subunit